MMGNNTLIISRETKRDRKESEKRKKRKTSGGGERERERSAFASIKLVRIGRWESTRGEKVDKKKKMKTEKIEGSSKAKT